MESGDKVEAVEERHYHCSYKLEGEGHNGAEGMVHSAQNWHANRRLHMVPGGQSMHGATETDQDCAHEKRTYRVLGHPSYYLNVNVLPSEVGRVAWDQRAANFPNFRIDQMKNIAFADHPHPAHKNATVGGPCFQYYHDFRSGSVRIQVEEVHQSESSMADSVVDMTVGVVDAVGKPTTSCLSLSWKNH